MFDFVCCHPSNFMCSNFSGQALRSKVEFHSLKTIRKQIETMELSLRGDSVDGQDDEESSHWDEDEVCV